MLNNQVVLVSGASGTLGSAIASAIVANNGKVVLSDINRGRGESIAGELGESNAYFEVADATDPDALDRIISSGISRFGKLDGAVHCAYPRSAGWGTSFEELRTDYLAEDLFGQLGGAIMFSQRVLHHFRNQGHGNLVHLSSIQGIGAPKFDHYVGTGMSSPIEYSAIKAGVIATTRWLAKYHKDLDIRVNCISLGGIRDKQPESFLRNYRAACLNKGMLDASDIVGAAVFLLSDNSRFINGQNIVVDDGWSL